MGRNTVRRKALSLGLCLALMVGLLSGISLKADAIDYQLEINGNSYVDSEDRSGQGWTYTTSTNTLTLNGFNGNAASDGDDGCVISYSGDRLLHIVLVGSNMITSPQGKHGISVGNHGFTVSGTGSLSVNGADCDSMYGISCGGSITVDGGTISVDHYAMGIFCTTEFTLNDGVVTSTAGADGLTAQKATINGGSINSTGLGTNGFQIVGGDSYVHINGGEVVAQSLATHSPDMASGIYCVGDVVITNGSLTAIGGTTDDHDEDFAIYLASSENVVKNSLAGKAWPDSSGTGIETTIAVNTTGHDHTAWQNAGYKKVQFGNGGSTGTSSSVTQAPRARSLTYNGSPQALVTTGAATGGTLKYVLGQNATTAPTTGWSASIPTGTNAGTYYVWYKVVGDNTHTDTTPVCITVTISSGDSGNTSPSSPSSGSSSSSTSSGSGTSNVTGNNYTITNSDGSTTKIKTTTNKTTGAVTDTVTTTYQDGSKKEVKIVTNKDGSGTYEQTMTAKDGAETKVSSVSEAGGKVTEISTSSVSANQKTHTDTQYKASGKKLTLVNVDTNEKAAEIPAKVTVNFVTYKVTKVGKDAFSGNKKVKSATIGKNVVSIGAGAFKNTPNLKQIIIKGKVKSVGEDAFKGTNKKVVIKVDVSKKNYNSVVNAIEKKSGVSKSATIKRI